MRVWLALTVVTALTALLNRPLFPAHATGLHVSAAAGSKNGQTAQVTPTATASPVARATKSGNAACVGCIQAVLKLVNADRAKYGQRPLTLQLTQSNGTGSCVGSYGHSRAMASTGALWHINPKYPRASFPRDICIAATSAGENVGEAEMGGVQAGLAEINGVMMSEPHDRSTCATSVSHACNILSSGFRTVGIGVYYANGILWLTEDFTG